jgi:hypothetical protein
MPSIYDDPDLQQESDFPDQVRFERTGDRVRGRVLTVEKINTRLGPVAKYLLMTDDGQRSLLAGAKNLWGQLLEIKPEPGDVLDIELIELRSVSNGTAKIFDVKVTHHSASSLAPPPAAQQRPDPGRASSPPRPTSDGSDIFDS